MKVIGIDPGTIITGYACVEFISGSIKTVDLGIIKPPKEEKLSTRYRIIFQSITILIEQLKPGCIAIETPFVYKNPQTAIKLGGAMGTILVAADLQGIEVYGYAPSEVRRGVLGIGSSSKQSIQNYLSRVLNLKEEALTKLDATDALAIAVHHLQESKKNPVQTSNSRRL
ncbi:MAG: crossover junction endodeoxyribonuclease RuvC [Chlamydia sp.]